VEEVKEGKSCAGFDDLLRSRIKSPAKELDMLFDGARAAAVLDGHFMNPICVDDEEGGVAGDGTFAKHTCMVELNFKAKGFQGNFDKF
jgi:hypothetical protein